MSLHLDLCKHFPDRFLGSVSQSWVILNKKAFCKSWESCVSEWRSSAQVILKLDPSMSYSYFEIKMTMVKTLILRLQNETS